MSILVMNFRVRGTKIDKVFTLEYFGKERVASSQKNEKFCRWTSDFELIFLVKDMFRKVN